MQPFCLLLWKSLHTLPHTRRGSLPQIPKCFLSNRNGGEEWKCVTEVWEGGKLLCKSWHEKYKNNFEVANPESNSQHLPWYQHSKKRHYIIGMQQSNKNTACFCASKVLTHLFRLEASGIELNFLYYVRDVSFHMTYTGENICEHFSVYIVLSFHSFSFKILHIWVG